MVLFEDLGICSNHIIGIHVNLKFPLLVFLDRLLTAASTGTKLKGSVKVFVSSKGAHVKSNRLFNVKFMYSFSFLSFSGLYRTWESVQQYKKLYINLRYGNDHPIYLIWTTSISQKSLKTDILVIKPTSYLCFMKMSLKLDG